MTLQFFGPQKSTKEEGRRRVAKSRFYSGNFSQFKFRFLNSIWFESTGKFNQLIIVEPMASELAQKRHLQDEIKYKLDQHKDWYGPPQKLPRSPQK